MVRRKNSTFVGSPPPDTARDASIFSRWVDNAAGDFALVFDKLTGSNSHPATDTINHTGAGRGCPLNLPLAAQHIGKAINLAGQATEEPYYIIAVPIFVPDGTQSYILEVDVSRKDDEEDILCEVRDTSWSLVSGPSPGVSVDLGLSRNPFRWYLSLGAGWQYLLVQRKLYLDDFDPGANLGGWRLYPDYVSAGESNGLIVPSSAAQGSPYPSLATLTPTTAQANDIDAGQTGADRPLDAWVLTRLNRSIGALWEYMSGAKIPGNNAYVCSTTRDLDQAALKLGDAAIDFPITCVALSCCPTDTVVKSYVGTIDTSAPTTGPIYWVRYPQVQATTAFAISYVRAWLPPFSTTSSLLKCEALFLSYQGDLLSDWRLSVTANGTSAEATFTQIGSTNFWRATVTAIPYTAGAVDDLRINVRSTVAATPINREFIFLGYALAFDAT